MANTLNTTQTDTNKLQKYRLYDLDYTVKG